MNSFININISEQIYSDIFKQFTKYNAEKYGVLGSYDGNSITNWEFINEKNSSQSSVILKKDTLECTVNKIWYKQGIKFVGLIHSHIDGQAYLSAKDVHAACEILKMNPQLLYIYMLIFHKSNVDKLYGYKLYYDKSFEKSNVQFSELILDII